jgi:hypothetical protein
MPGLSIRNSLLARRALQPEQIGCHQSRWLVMRQRELLRELRQLVLMGLRLARRQELPAGAAAIQLQERSGLREAVPAGG